MTHQDNLAAVRAAVGELDAYDAVHLSDFGGGNVEWWQDYIRAELGRAHEFYQDQHAATLSRVEAQARREEQWRVWKKVAKEFADFTGTPDGMVIQLMALKDGLSGEMGKDPLLTLTQPKETE